MLISLFNSRWENGFCGKQDLTGEILEKLMAMDGIRDAVWSEIVKTVGDKMSGTKLHYRPALPRKEV